MNRKAARRHGLLLIDKPQGLTSHDVAAKVRRLAGQRQVGHTGTLDPMATGLMAMLLGSATRLEPWLTKMDKIYTGRVELGLSTDTDDVTGRELSRSSGPWPDEAAVRLALKSREGEGDQTPPAFSAVQVNGQRAYKAARAGRPLALAPRRVKAFRLELTGYGPPLIDFTAEVSSGYYIRSLARDLGGDFGLGGALSALRREKVGPWTIDQAVTLEALAAWTEDDWAERLITPAEALPHLPALILDEDQARRFAQGQKVPVSEGVRSLEDIQLSEGTMSSGVCSLEDIQLSEGTMSSGVCSLEDIQLSEGTVSSGVRSLEDIQLSEGAMSSGVHHKILSPEGLLLGLGEIEPSLGGIAPRRPFLRPLRVFPVE